MPAFGGLETADEVRGFYDEYQARLLARPEVTDVALADRVPLGAAVQQRAYRLPGVESERADGLVSVDNASVDERYLGTMDVDILAGRGFEPSDADGAPVVVVSQAFVERYYPGRDVVGMSVEDGGGRSKTIVGVAADTKVRTLGEDPRPYVYELLEQVSSQIDEVLGAQVIVRGTASSEELARVAKEVLDEVSPDMVLFEEIKTMNEHLALILFPARMAALLLSVFGGLALVLSAIGVYGTVSYAVAKRTRELGIRMSLGATPRDVTGMAVSGGMRLVLVGGVIGIGLAGAVTWLASGYLYGISATDVATFAAIPALLGVVALVAAWIPARRAGTVDPVRALRGE
jgi:ABC-type antimicrobial peptide transport system permease subunit